MEVNLDNLFDRYENLQEYPYIGVGWEPKASQLHLVFIFVGDDASDKVRMSGSQVGHESTERFTRWG